MAQGLPPTPIQKHTKIRFHIFMGDPMVSGKLELLAFEDTIPNACLELGVRTAPSIVSEWFEKTFPLYETVLMDHPPGLCRMERAKKGKKTRAETGVNRFLHPIQQNEEWKVSCRSENAAATHMLMPAFVLELAELDAFPSIAPTDNDKEYAQAILRHLGFDTSPIMMTIQIPTCTPTPGTDCRTEAEKAWRSIFERAHARLGTNDIWNPTTQAPRDHCPQHGTRSKCPEYFSSARKEDRMQDAWLRFQGMMDGGGDGVPEGCPMI